MMVTFVSQCEKNSLKKTRRVLDAFAERIGDNTWQTVITEDGLNTVKKMLSDTASKHTAVSCHWIRSRSRSQLIWVVGKRSKFNKEGCVPVNYTKIEIDTFYDEEAWQTLDLMYCATGIAALFHDFGKANSLFQDKLKGLTKSKGEPYRHEWVSLRLFQAFVGRKSDEQWLDSLANDISPSDFEHVLRDGLDHSESDANPLLDLSDFAKLVGWLILTHHRLPLLPTWKDDVSATAKFKDNKEWFETNFTAQWNSYNCKAPELQQFLEQNWNVTNALPVQSMQWRSRACDITSKAKTLLRPYLNEPIDWLNDQLYTTHLSRLCLMLADHHYSAQEEVTPQWRNPNYEIYANTQRETNQLKKGRQLKQQLDEHLIGVAHHAQKIVNALPKLNRSLSQLKHNDFLANNVEKAHKDAFGWQDKAKKLALKISKDTLKQGFFGINMASTGKGKTLANAKIMYALGEQTGRVRFSVALGLRTLTLQTGQEFRDKLGLNAEELAIVVGGIAVKELFENAQFPQGVDGQNDDTGSESENEYLDPDLLVDYEGAIYEHSLSEWTQKNGRLQKLLAAPVLTCTIDHLIPACEGIRGGKQIGPMLRLLTSNLVLDEPDDFGLSDLPALCRLVHWAGMLGSRVLLSTATMPPALTFALFQAYHAGWGEYAKANILNYDGKIVCAWFDEFASTSKQFGEFKTFQSGHNKFIQGRVKHLQANTQIKRLAKIVTVELVDHTDVAFSFASTVHSNLVELHKNHHQNDNEQMISIGLVRMANINPLVAVAKALLKFDAPANTCIHYCVYHGGYPLAIRSYIEEKLDAVLKRNAKDVVWPPKDVQSAVRNHPERNHIFVVLASPVAEVGRDHDYDWAIVEPSSMRSIIQIAGRVLRHRDQTPTLPNIILLNKNFKALKGQPICFNRPGFESATLTLASHDLFNILDEAQYAQPNAIPRIELPVDYYEPGETYLNLNMLEHKALSLQLFSGEQPAKIWWKNQVHWCAEVQSQQRFRDAKKDEAYYLWVEDDHQPPYWRWKNEQVYPAKFGDCSGIDIKHIDENDANNEIELGTNSYFWFDLDTHTRYSELACDFGINLAEVSLRFAEVRITEYQNQQIEYTYYKNLGIYQEIGK